MEERIGERNTADLAEKDGCECRSDAVAGELGLAELDEDQKVADVLHVGGEGRFRSGAGPHVRLANQGRADEDRECDRNKGLPSHKERCKLGMEGAEGAEGGCAGAAGQWVAAGRVGTVARRGTGGTDDKRERSRRRVGRPQNKTVVEPDPGHKDPGPDPLRQGRGGAWAGDAEPAERGGGGAGAERAKQVAGPPAVEHRQPAVAFPLVGGPVAAADPRGAGCRRAVEGLLGVLSDRDQGAEPERVGAPRPGSDRAAVGR